MDSAFEPRQINGKARAGLPTLLPFYLLGITVISLVTLALSLCGKPTFQSDSISMPTAPGIQFLSQSIRIGSGQKAAASNPASTLAMDPDGPQTGSAERNHQVYGRGIIPQSRGIAFHHENATNNKNDYQFLTQVTT